MGDAVPAEAGPLESLTMVEATKRAVDAASHLQPTDWAVVQLWLRLARAVDDIDDEGLNPAGKLDNVSMPAYLKTAEALGMTPASRGSKAAPAKRPDELMEAPSVERPSNVSQLRGPLAG